MSFPGGNESNTSIKKTTTRVGLLLVRQRVIVSLDSWISGFEFQQYCHCRPFILKRLVMRLLNVEMIVKKFSLNAKNACTDCDLEALLTSTDEFHINCFHFKLHNI